ncbi:MAG: phospholipase D family protein [Pseudomonadota bacterium]
MPARCVRPVRPLRAIAFATACALVVATVACTALRPEVERTPSVAIEDDGTRLARAFAEPLARRPGHSGVAILDDGPLAWLSRVSLADVADRTVDVQYYIYENDDSGLILLHRLAAAAERGVRVRLLIDDSNNVGRDLQLASIDRHRNIQVRVFNPMRFRERWTRPFQYVFDLARANRRMHNKIYAVDGMAAIVGGRNIGDNYFNFDREQPNFRDVDLLVVGPAAREITRAFDLYWNSPWAYPAESLVDVQPTVEDGDRLRRALATYARQNERVEGSFPAARRDWLQSLLAAHENLQWASVEVVVDEPGKVAPRGEPKSAVGVRLNEEMARTREELLIESAYFVPRRTGMRLFAHARGRGVRTRILTNSLSSTDVAAVHAGYQKRRRALLRMGVELYEFQREAARTRPQRRGLRNRGAPVDGSASEASLHSKVMVFDRRVAWVGSFNLDPRSRELNTEIGLFVHDAAVAERLARMVETTFEPHRAWRVTLEDGRLVWTGERDGRLVREHHEPDTTWQLRALVTVLARVPGIDSLL